MLTCVRTYGMNFRKILLLKFMRSNALHLWASALETETRIAGGEQWVSTRLLSARMQQQIVRVQTLACAFALAIGINMLRYSNMLRITIMIFHCFVASKDACVCEESVWLRPWCRHSIARFTLVLPFLYHGWLIAISRRVPFSM